MILNRKSAFNFVFGGGLEVIWGLQSSRFSQGVGYFSERKGLGIYRISKIGQKRPNRLSVLGSVPDAEEDAGEDAQLLI